MAKNLTIAADIQEAINAKKSNAVYLAGGTEINRLNSYVTADDLVSIKRVDDLKKIEVCGDEIKIGSMVTFQELIDSKEVPEYLKDGANNMGARTKRNMATIGGNIASLRDDSYLLPVLLGANAKLRLMDLDGSIKKEVSICEYVKNADAYKNMLIMCIRVSTSRTVYNKRYSNTKESLARVTVGLGHDGNLGDVTIGVAVKGMGVLFLDDLAKKIEDSKSLTDEEAGAYFDELCKDLKDDFYGSCEYKKYLLKVTIVDMVKGGIK